MTVQFLRRAWLPLTLLLGACMSPAAVSPPAGELAGAVQQTLAGSAKSGELRRRALDQALADFYAARDHMPAWIQQARPIAQAETLLTRLANADDDGLNPRDYRVSALRERMARLSDQRAPSAQAIADLDMQLSAAFLHYASDVHAGRVAPTRIDPLWQSSVTPLDYPARLRAALKADDFTRALDALAPPHAGYRQLRAALKRLRADDSPAWPTVPEGDVLEPGDRSPRVAALRRRLAAQGFIPAVQAPASEVFDDTLSEAVTRFQKRHGLAVDGLLGPGTTQALNVSRAARIHQIELNMERWRWLPAELGPRHVIANIPGYRVQAIANGQVATDMRAVVGEQYNDHATPLFTDRIESIVFGPYWNIPHSIAMDEVLPEARRDPDYLARKHYEIVSSYAPDAQVFPVTPANLDKVAAEKLRIRERPGPGNALGRVKFLFPNEYAIYLHDSPAEHLFRRDQRAFSHGCIRLEKPAQMAAFLLAGRTGWDSQAIDHAMNNGERREVELDETVPVYLLYWTAWMDNEQLHLAPDVYGYDDKLDQALRAAGAPQ